MKAIVLSTSLFTHSQLLFFQVGFFDTTTTDFRDVIELSIINRNLVTNDLDGLKTKMQEEILIYSNDKSYGITEQDILWAGFNAMSPTIFQSLKDSKIVTRVNSVLKSNCKEYHTSGTVSGGTVTFYLTDDGTSGGTAIFTNIYKDSAKFWVDDALIQYQFGNYTVSGDNKSITVTINKLGTVLLGIIQFVSSADGFTVYLSIKGD